MITDRKYHNHIPERNHEFLLRCDVKKSLYRTRQLCRSGPFFKKKKLNDFVLFFLCEISCTLKKHNFNFDHAVRKVQTGEATKYSLEHVSKGNHIF